MFRFLKKYMLRRPHARGLYAFTKHRRGDFILFIKEVDSNTLEFMQIPDRSQLFLTTEDFNSGILTNLFEFVEALPSDVFEVCVNNIETYQN